MVEANRIDTAYAVPQTAGLSTLPGKTGGTTSALTSGLATGTGLLGHQQPASNWVRKDRGEYLDIQPQPTLQTTATTLQQQPLIQQTTQTFPQQTFVREEFVGAAPTAHVIQERPVLDRVEKLLHKEVIQKPLIQEQVRQDIIEVHERPIEKRFMHPVQEFHVQDQGRYEVQGREFAELERNRLLNQIREQDRLRRVQVDQRQDVRVLNEAPQHFQNREMRREVIQKPIVTEIHEQPIREIHEQNIQRTVYQKPIVTLVRDQKIIENLQSSTAIPYERDYIVQQQQLPQTQFVSGISQQPFVQSGVVGSNQYFDRSYEWDERYERPEKHHHLLGKHEKKRDKYYERYGDDRIGQPYTSDRFIGGPTYASSSGLMGSQQQGFIPSTGYSSLSGQQGFIPSDRGLMGQQGYGQTFLPQSSGLLGSQQQGFIPSSGLSQPGYSTQYVQPGLMDQQRFIPSQQGYSSGLMGQQGLTGGSMLGTQQPIYGTSSGLMGQQGLTSGLPQSSMMGQQGFTGGQQRSGGLVSNLMSKLPGVGGTQYLQPTSNVQPTQGGQMLRNY